MKHLFTRLAVVGAVIVTALAATPTATARPMFFGDLLPPPGSRYINDTDSISYLGGFVVIRNIDHFGFSNSFPPPTGGGSTIDNFNSTVTVDGSVNNGPFLPLQGNALTSVRVTHIGTIGPTATFDTEMLALNIVGGTLPPGVMLRESPTIASLGQTTITNLGGGQYNIDSFFDIFTELSLDGGQTWNPGTSSAPGGAERVRLVPAPAAGLALLGLGLASVRRRRA